MAATTSSTSLPARLARIWRHRWTDEADLRRALPPELLDRLTAHVGASERRHSGEIRICVEAGLPTSYLWRDATADRLDGLRLDWPDRWLHVRGSNTEPIVRVIAEAPTRAEAEAMCRDAGIALQQ